MKHIDLEDIEEDIIDHDDFDENIVLNKESSISKEDITESSMEDILKDSTIELSTKDIPLAIIYNLYKKEYGSKISRRPLSDYLSKEHKCNISIKQQT
ncbi:200_t:CDS:2 [Funneliformis geosporum]|nr:200_t:CDS:2 [Funneliformis geosporum]